MLMKKGKDDSGAKRNDKYGLSPEEFEKHKMTELYTENLGNENEILSLIRVVVKEGKKRMVRRLFAALDLFVLGEYIFKNWKRTTLST